MTDRYLIWPHFGEIRQTVDAPGRDRGSRHMPRIDDAYVRSGPTADEEARPASGDPLAVLLKLLFTG